MAHNFFRTEASSLPVSLSLSFGPDTVTYTGLILLATGLLLGFWGLRRVKKSRSSCLIYMRGMPGMHDLPPIEDLPPKYRFGEVTHLSLDTHSKKPKDVLDNIEMLKRILDDKILSMNIEAPTIVFAGLAPVPLLFAAGVRFSNRSNVMVMDYNRFEQKWHMLDELSDNETIKVDYPENSVSTEIAIAMPFTLSISKSHIPLSVRDKTIWVGLNKSEPKADALSSEEKLKQVLRNLHDMIRNLRSRKGYENIKTIHLFIAAQSSTIFKLGTEYQANIYPEVRIYHYDGAKGEYSWAISVKNGQIDMVSYAENNLEKRK